MAFDSRSTGNADIFVMDSQGGPPQKITGKSSHEILPSFSRDGHWVYFASNRTGAWQVWKVRSTGGLAVQVTRQGGFAAFESPDGRFLYYAKGLTVPGLWRIPTNGGEETEVIGSPEAGYWGDWAVVEGASITSIRRPRNPESLSSTSRPIGLRARSIWRTQQPSRRLDWPSRRTRRRSFTHNWMRQIVTSCGRELPIDSPHEDRARLQRHWSTLPFLQETKAKRKIALKIALTGPQQN
jgi:WD40-like Beta Propeller Repeat